MGAFRVFVEIADPNGERWQRVEALVDTGSTYTWVPSELLRGLGVAPRERREFETAGGAIIEREIGETRVRVEGRECGTIVVFGGEGSGSALGAVTLESCGLGVDPVRARLVPVRALAWGFR